MSHGVCSRSGSGWPWGERCRYRCRCTPGKAPERDDIGRGGELSEMRHNLFGEHFHVVDLAVEVAGFRAEPEP